MNDIKFILQYTQELDVLYVEDDDILLQVNHKLFQNYFKTVTTTKNGQEGLDAYISYKKQYEKHYDLVLADIEMPQLDGLQMSEKILEINPMQSIIITTAHNEAHYLSQAIQLGVTAFITKPIHFENFNLAILKAAQAICDHRFVEEHIEMIENLNIQLENQNQELVQKNAELEKSFRMLDTFANKKQMTQQPKKAKEEETESSINKEHFMEQITYLVTDDLYELQEILDEIDKSVINFIANTEDIDFNSLENLINLFMKYTNILQMYSFFMNLSLSMTNFAQTMKDEPIPQNTLSIQNIFMLLESFIYVLNKWHKDISSGNPKRINQFDDSIISDMHTITNMWIQKEETFDEEDMDDIFDF